ncbi:MAG: 23S rRNA (uracil(1939)-C(5))-methyltransferase RlmD, partial [Candidatus Borkfalkiaceae bacterium]|nr:23S rRNA (uracil(1939)-C(5))-methyltransferase RlmD [Christensenellaceae bacterium]
MLVKNSEYVAKIDSLGCNGEGICKLEGCAVFVPFALPGETVKVKIVKVKSNYAFGKLIQILTPSEKRVESDCPVFFKCGGCSLRHLDYSEQLKWKGEQVKNCFSSVAGIKIECGEAINVGDNYRYRNKLQLPVRHTEKGNVIGFFREGSHDVTEISDCLIQKEWAAKLISAFKKYLELSGESCFDEITSRGNVKHLVARSVSDKLIVTVVITTEKLKNSELLTKILSETFDCFSLYVNVNKLNNNVIFGEKFIHVFGEKRFSCEEDGIKFFMGPESFMQVNDEVRRRIYADVCGFAKDENNSAIIDAYSGAGFLTANLAKYCDKVYGIEIIKEAVDCADELARMNGLSDKMTNMCGACENVLPELVKKIDKTRGITVVLDPPRKGVEERVINAVKSVSPSKIIYVSCNPATLARDVGLITGSIVYDGNQLKKAECPEGLYEITHIQAYDMFPFTKHVETLVVLSHKKPDSHLEVKIDFDNTSLDKMAISERAEKRKPQEKTT